VYFDAVSSQPPANEVAENKIEAIAVILFMIPPMNFFSIK
jgi:hypothetical protein